MAIDNLQALMIVEALVRWLLQDKARFVRSVNEAYKILNYQPTAQK
jgi:hypothetical protein